MVISKNNFTLNYNQNIKWVFGYTEEKIDFKWIDFSKKWVECKVVYVLIYSRKIELNNKFQCKNHVLTQKLQILISIYNQF